MEHKDDWFDKFIQKADECTDEKAEERVKPCAVNSEAAEFFNFVGAIGYHIHDLFEFYKACKIQKEQHEKDFIVVFGGRDKLGKTTVATKICEECPELGFSYKKFPNPDSYSGQQLRSILQGKLPFEPASFQALNFVDKLLTPLTGRLIVDRYSESSAVYGKADGLPAEWVDAMNRYLRQPDLTFIFTGEPFGTDNEHYDSNNKIAQGYTDFLVQNKGNERVIEIQVNNRSIEDVTQEVIEHIKRFD